MLATANIWADVIATLVVLVIAGFWGFQVAGNIVTGRFRRKFVEKQWPHHEGRVPVLPRLLHGMHVATMVALIFSGVYLRYPFFAGGRDLLRNVHYVAMYILIANFAVRLLHAVARDYLEFRITEKDILNGPRVLLYYTFVTRSYPHLAKYNVMQKFTYGVAFPSLIVLQALSGFAVLWPDTMLWWAEPVAGGVAAAAAWARLVHYLGALALIMLTGIHVCLAWVEDFPALLVFFGLARQKEHAPAEPALEAPTPARPATGRPVRA